VAFVEVLSHITGERVTVWIGGIPIGRTPAHTNKRNLKNEA
jgi:hypothetical protein